MDNKKNIPTNSQEDIKKKSQDDNVWSVFRKEIKWQTIKKALTTEYYLPFDPQRKTAAKAKETYQPSIGEELIIDYTDEKSFIEKVCNEIGFITPNNLKDILDRLLSTPSQLEEDLILQEILTPNQLEKAKEVWKEKGGNFWQILISLNYLQPVSFSQFLLSVKEFPLISKTQGFFSDKLVSWGIVKRSEIEQAIVKQKGSNKSLPQILIEMGIVSPTQMAKALSEFLNVPYLEITDIEIPAELVKIFPNSFVDSFKVLPIKIEESIITIVSPEPITPLIRSLIKLRILYDVSFSICSYDDFEDKYEYYKELYKQVIANQASYYGLKRSSDEGEIEVVDNIPAVDLVGEIIESALRTRATDIHIEPQRGYIRIRLRVDGILYEMMRVSPMLANELCSRVKVLADLDITEKRLAQDGHFVIKLEDKIYDMRVGTAPTHFGERISIRLADSSKIITELTSLGFEPKDLHTLSRLIRKPYGIILTTGPTGSGKTTTLYATLRQIDSETQNIMTIEDPVEYEIAGISQIEVNYKINFDFVKGLRAILRQDPDTVMIGEIRDEETAIIAVRAAMTGVRVLSSLHTNDSVGAITRLINLKVPPYLVSSALLGVIAQRLVRKICPNCKEDYQPDKTLIKELGFEGRFSSKDKFYRGAGCEQCNKTGYLGRTGVYEVLTVDDEIRTMILENSSEAQIRKKALEKGMVDLVSAGIHKVKQGITTIDEFFRVLA